MKIIKNTHQLATFSSKILANYTGSMKLGVFDIETLGLNSAYAPVILVGLMTVDSDGKAEVMQYFAETPEDEKFILENLRDDFKKFDFLLTYNGKHFDMPFIEKRAKKLGVNGFDFSIYNLDLYLVLNGYSQLKSITKNLKQKTVEQYMGLASIREDTISGADSVKLYYDFLACEDVLEKINLEEKILLHNHDDLIQLYQLMPILKEVDLHKAFNGLGFPIPSLSGWPSLTLTYIKVTNAALTLKGKYGGEPFLFTSYDNFDRNYSCDFREYKTFEFKLHINRHKGNIFLNLPAYFDDYEDMKKYPNYINNFLFISDGKNSNALEINMFVKKFMEKFMEENICPKEVLFI
jgi:hypothetical protein